MVQASDEQGRKTYVEARGSVKYYHTNEEQTSKGWFWCHERKDLFRWDEFINYKYK